MRTRWHAKYQDVEQSSRESGDKAGRHLFGKYRVWESPFPSKLSEINTLCEQWCEWDDMNKEHGHNGTE